MGQQGIASSGTLDKTFNETGILKFPIPAISGAAPDAVLALPGGKVLAVVSLSGQNAGYAVTRLDADSSLDNSFGANQDGVVVVPLENFEFDHIFGVSPTESGGWVIFAQASLPGSHGLMIVRHHEDGRLDESLNGTGILHIPYEDYGSSGYTGVMVSAARRGDKSAEGGKQASAAGSPSVIVQPDGKLLLVGNVGDEFGKMKGIVLRRNKDGSPDTTFKGRGAAIIELEGFTFDWSSSEGIALQEDGHILVCGHFNADEGQTAYVTRLTAAGEVDRGFNGGLAVTVFSPSLINLVAMTVRKSDGRIIAVGNAFMTRSEPRKGLIVALNSTGSYNLPFNKGKPLFADFVAEGLSWRRCVTQTNGSVIVSGSTGDGFVKKELSIVTACYRSDGSLETAFNGQGYVVFDEALSMEGMTDMSMQGTDRFFVCGNLWKDAEPWPHINGGVLLCYSA